MITYYAKVYNATTEEWIDNTARQFSIGQYVGQWTQYENPFIENEGQEITSIPATDISYNYGNNIGSEITAYARLYHSQTDAWPVVRICTTNSSDDYYIEWSHNAPNDLKIVAGGSAIIWRSCLQWNETSDIRSSVFVTAGSVRELNTEGLVFGGATYNDNGTQKTLIAYNGVNVSVNNAAAIVSAPTVLSDVYTYPSNFHIVTSKLQAGNAVVFAAINSTVHMYYLWSLAPAINGALLPGWNKNINQGSTGSFAYKEIQFQYSREVRGYNRGTFYVMYLGERTIDNNEQCKEVLDEIGVTIVYNKVVLYTYLTPPAPPSPVPPSDVDPDNPPDPDEPPEPIPPDDQDPYYDPTSDPDSPEYDPTKDPDSPEYDPSEPDTPHRPPSTEDGGDPPVKPPVDPVTPPPTPPSHAINSRFVTLYTPSLSQLNALAEYLWSPAWSIDGFKKIFANPMDCILGLMIFPALAAPSGSKEVNVGNLSTGVTMSYIDNQYVEVNCGSFEITEYYASYLDYDPYTKIEIYLPYIGTHRLSADDVMAKTIQLKYMIDLLSGACVAFLVVDGTTLYTFTGSCATPIPVSGNDWSNMVNGILSVAGAATAAVISGGTAATMAAGALASTSLFVSSHKEHIRHGGSVASAAGLMSIQTPYLIVTRPRQALPIGQNSFQGYPSFMTESLGSLSGYTEVESCHLEHIPCTDEELKEIERLLKGGVLF